MAAVALQQLAELHRAMYERAMADARDLLGLESSSIARYAKEFEESLPNTYKRVPAKRISQALDHHRILLFGDFHSHKQCQRALLRVIRTYQNTPDHAPMIVMLEMFRATDQKILDLWYEGKISDEDLIERTHYEQIWGFPWQNYKPILEFCRSHSIPLLAANTPNAGKDGLKVRDDFAAKIMADTCKSHPSARIIYMVGEYHLANSQLPQSISAIDESLSVMRLIVNSDKYFFMLPTDRIHRGDEFLELNDAFFCIINSPPWIKWQSQTLMDELRRIGSSTYITSEMSHDFQEDTEFADDGDYDEDDFYFEDVMDVDGHLKNAIDHLSQYLGIKNPSQYYDSFKIVTSITDEEIDHLPPSSRIVFLEKAARDGSASDFERRITYLHDISANNLAFAAGQIIFGTSSSLTENYVTAHELFISEVLKYTLAYLANKILNPRIMLHSRKAVDDYIGATRGKRISGQSKTRRDIARNTLKFLSLFREQAPAQMKSIKRRKDLPIEMLELDARSSHDLARHIGQVIVSGLYQKLITGRLDATDMRRFFTRKLDRKAKCMLFIDELIQLI